MRDTGWQADGTRDVGDFRLAAYASPGTMDSFRARLFHVGSDGDAEIEHDLCGPIGAATLDDAKRAAEDALRQFCRDTLACLGDG